MVKLRVTARIIPETEYLAYVDSATPTASIRGEKKFHVIVQEPEKWYIGTLANAVQQKYQNLYKHELGQIKYLKSDEDDCDLDPEEGVVDLLVNEGRALVDKSDQNVVIKVIREQGRAVRHGSVIPDLTPIHYQLPTRPPVPRFENVESSLGKRNADNEPTEAQHPKRRKSRLSEIEEDNEIAASIEGGPAIDMVIQDSQPMQQQPVDQSLSSVRTDEQEPIWSFSQLGPPVTLGPSEPSKTPVRNDGYSNGAMTLGSPNTDASSSRKRFLRPVRDVYEYPESDIDDSQASTTAQETSKIIPRLVSHRSNQVDNIGAATHVANGVLKPTGLTDPHQSDSNDLSAERQSKPTQNHDSESWSTPHVKKRKSAINSNQDKSPRFNSSQNIMDILNGEKVSSDTAQNVHELPSKVKRVPTPGKSHTTTPAKSRNPETYAARSSEQDTANNATGNHTTLSGIQQADAIEQAVNSLTKPKKRRLSTPPPDSPSEQLAQALRESARKPTTIIAESGLRGKDKGISQTPKLSKASNSASKPDLIVPDAQAATASNKDQSDIAHGETLKKRKSSAGRESSQVAANGSGEQDKPKKARKKKTLGTENQDSSQKQTSLTGVRNPATANASSASTTSKETPHGEVMKRPSIEKPAVPPAIIAKSVDTSSSRSANVVLPPGMSRADFDKLVAEHAHLDRGEKIRKAKSTSSLRASEPRSLRADSVKDDAISGRAPAAKEKKKQASGSPTLGSKELGVTGTSNKLSTAQANRLEETPSKPAKSTTSRAGTVDSKKTAQQATSSVSDVNMNDATSTTKGNTEAALDYPAKPKLQSTPTAAPVTAISTSGRSGKDVTPSVSSKSGGATSKITSSTPTKIPGSMQPPTSKVGSETAKPTSAKRASTPKSQSARSTSVSSAQSTAKEKAVAAKLATVGPAVPPKRPTLTGPNSIYSARSLKELAKLSGSTYNSPTTSAVASPSVTTQHRVSFLGKASNTPSNNKKRTLFNNDTSDDDDDDDSSSDSSSSEEDNKAPSSSSRKQADDIKTKTPAKAKTNTETKTESKLKSTSKPATKPTQNAFQTPIAKKTTLNPKFDANVNVDEDSGSESTSDSDSDSSSDSDSNSESSKDS